MEDYKFTLGYQPIPEEVARARREAQARKLAAGKGFLKHYAVKPHSHTLNRQFLHKGDNVPLYGFLEPCYIKEKGILVPRVEVFNQ